MDNNQIRTNALISYMFLGWIFLLAGSNPNFNHEFIRKHSKKATKIHLAFLIIFIAYNFFLSKYFYYAIPLLSISVDKIINLVIFFFLTASILKGCYKAHKGFEPDNISLKESYDKNKLSYDLKDLSESEKMLYLSSLLPFLGIISAKNHENEFTRSGVKIGSIATFLIISYYILNGLDSIFLISLFVYIFIIVYYFVNVIINNTFSVPKYIENIPNLRFLYVIIKTGIYYSADFIKLVFGKNKNLNFKQKALQINNEEQMQFKALNEYHTETHLLLPKNLILIPIFNLIFLPSIFSNKKSKYFLAMFQGIIISLIIILIWINYGLGSNVTLIMLFPVFLLIANIDTNPFYKIPIIYEIYKLVDFVSFGFFKKVQNIKENNLEKKEVKIKI